MEFNQLVTYAQENHASDIHLIPDMPPMIRVHGDIREVRVAPINAEFIQKLMDSLMNDNQKALYKSEMELDFSIAVGTNCRFRINAYTTFKGPTVAFRFIPFEVQSLSQISGPAVLESFTRLSQGLVLVTGPTGSGKSTTLAAMIDHINKNYSKHIITIEDPIEFLHKSQKCLVNQREVGSHTKSFANALRSSLREDPDVILVGELRDRETISLALTAAETGHLVFATVHTASTAKTIDRIVDVFPGDDKDMIRTMLAGSLEGVVGQRLLKRADGQGRVVAHEVMVGTSAIRNLIRENKIPQMKSLIQVGSQKGMILMEDSVKNLMNQGVITQEEAYFIIKQAEDEVKHEVGNNGVNKSSMEDSGF